MEKGWYVEQLTPGTAFADGLFPVRSASPRPEGMNGPKITLVLARATGEGVGNGRCAKWRGPLCVGVGEQRG